MTNNTENPLRICAVDAGSNSLKMRIAQVDGNKATPVYEARYPIRLGAGVFSGGRLDRAIIQETCAAFEEIVRIAQTHKVTRYRAVATSAAREAINGLQLCEAVRLRSGWDLEIISGAEEARLVSKALRQAFANDHTNLIIDVGGGSTEIIIHPKDSSRPVVHSLALGAVRLRELAGLSNPPDSATVDRLNSLIARAIAVSDLDKLSGPINAVGVAGTIRALGDILNTSFDGPSDKIRLEELDQLLNKVRSLTEEDMVSKFGIDRARSQILLPGALIVSHIMKRLGVEEIAVSTGGVRDGIIEELTGTESMPFESAYIRIGTKYQFERQHEAHVAALASSLFDQLQPLHELEEDWKPCLQAAAWLHDIGQFISYTKHHKHSWYLIMNEALPEDLQQRQAAIACIARYHRKAHPRLDHPEYLAMPEEDRRPIAICAGILRIADALDRRHLQKVTGCDVLIQRDKLKFTLLAQDRASEERAAFTKKSALLEEIFDRDIELVVQDITNAD